MTPSALIYAGLLALAIGVDYVLHLLRLASVGRYLGIVGTLLLAVSFTYSLRKRGYLKGGNARSYLAAHEALGWVGAARRRWWSTAASTSTPPSPGWP